jgi:hypothetical protein
MSAAQGTPAPRTSSTTTSGRKDKTQRRSGSKSRIRKGDRKEYDAKRRKKTAEIVHPHSDMRAQAVAAATALNYSVQGHALTKGEASMLLRMLQQEFVKQIDAQLSGQEATEAEIIKTSIQNVAGDQQINEVCIRRLHTAYALNLAKEFELNTEGPVDYKKAVPNAAEDMRRERNEKAKMNGRSFKKIPRDQWATMEKAVADRIKKHRSAVTIKNIREMWGIAPFHRTLGRNTTREFLLKLGFTYNQADKSVRQLSPTRLGRIRRFLIEYCDALEQERSGGAVIVVMDESYCNQHHNCATWNKIDTSTGESTVDGAPGRGKRIIICDAITKDGLLRRLATPPTGDAMDVEDEEETPNWYHKEGAIPQVSRLDRELSVNPNLQDFEFKTFDSSELIFPAGRAKNKEGAFIGAATRGDYHDNFDGHVFMLWVERRLTPAFAARYGSDMKMILILDNAEYHHGLVDDFIGVEEKHSPSKYELYTWMDEFQMTSIDITVDASSTNIRKKNNNWEEGDAPKTVTIQRVAQSPDRKTGGEAAKKKNLIYSGKTFLRGHSGVSNAEFKIKKLESMYLQIIHNVCVQRLSSTFTHEDGS